MARTMTAPAGFRCYLYGVTRPPVSNPPQVPGVDGESKIEALDCAGLICWLSRVPAEDLGKSFAQAGRFGLVGCGKRFVTSALSRIG